MFTKAEPSQRPSAETVVGVTFAIISGQDSIVTVIVVSVAHCPAFGINVYIVVPNVFVVNTGEYIPVIIGASTEVMGREIVLFPRQTVSG